MVLIDTGTIRRRRRKRGVTTIGVELVERIVPRRASGNSEKPTLLRS